MHNHDLVDPLLYFHPLFSVFVIILKTFIMLGHNGMHDATSLNFT